MTDFRYFLAGLETLEMFQRTERQGLISSFTLLPGSGFLSLVIHNFSGEENNPKMFALLVMEEL